MINELLELLDKKEMPVKLEPEVKVKRETDTLYISGIRKHLVAYMAVVEVYNSKGKSDKAPVPLRNLDEVSIKAILIRLKGTSEVKKRHIQHI